MKNLLYLTLILFYTNGLFAQEIQGITFSHYVFPEFTEGSVKKKTGTIDRANLNYNSLTQEFIFESGDNKYALAQIFTIDSVFIGNTKFVPVDSVFYEVVDTKTPVKLFIQHKCKVETPGKDIGYGGNSQTSAATNLTSINNPSGSRMVYNLQLPSEYKITPYSEFWLKQGNEYVKINNAKQLQKVFPEKEVLIKDYIKKNRPDFKKMKEVIDLINVVGV